MLNFKLNNNSKLLLKIVVSLVVVFTSLNTPSLSAEVFTIARPLTDEGMMIGVEGQSNINPDDTRVNGYFGYGLTSQWDLIIKAGAGTSDPMLGADVQYYFGNFSIFEVALKGGFYYLNELFLNVTPIVTHKFEWVSLSVGAAFNMQLTEEAKLGTSIYAGMNFPINKTIDIRVEGGLKLSDNYYNWLSAGLVYFF